MSIDYGLLRTLHRLLKQQNDILNRMDRGPRKVKIVTTNEANFLTAMNEAKEIATKTRMASDAKQLQLDEREAKIEDLKNRLNACDSNKEYQLLKDRIAADIQANSVLQDEILEQLEKLDTLVANSDEAKENYAKSQLETQKITEQVESELAQLTSELERIQNDLAETEKKLPGELKDQYRRLVNGKGEDALGETDLETCGNCNRRMTTQFSADLIQKNAKFCEGCGCLMYIKESHPAGR